jgi:hypothetical protein
MDGLAVAVRGVLTKVAAFPSEKRLDRTRSEFAKTFKAIRKSADRHNKTLDAVTRWFDEELPSRRGMICVERTATPFMTEAYGQAWSGLLQPLARGSLKAETFESWPWKQTSAHAMAICLIQRKAASLKKVCDRTDQWLTGRAGGNAGAGDFAVQWRTVFEKAKSDAGQVEPLVQLVKQAAKKGSGVSEAEVDAIGASACETCKRSVPEGVCR